MTVSNSYTMLVHSNDVNEGPVSIDFLNLKKAALILRALNHKLRQQIIKLIDEQRKMTVTEIYVKLRLEQSVASQHLAILRFIYYSISTERIAQVGSFVTDLVG
jgi:ArsR family transcriptional regulator, virulence genes transcriptional regulator